MYLYCNTCILFSWDYYFFRYWRFFNDSRYWKSTQFYKLFFLFMCFKKFEFRSEFVKWIKILIKNPKSCVVNDVKTLLYFKLEWGTRLGHPISAYIFIVALEAIFTLINADPNIEGLQFFSYNLLHSAYVDDTTFFLRNGKSALQLINTFDMFSLFFGLKINKEIVWICWYRCQKGSEGCTLWNGMYWFNGRYYKHFSINFF